MSGLGDVRFLVRKKLFGTTSGTYELRWPLRTIEGIDDDDPEQFATFIKALPEALPADATLRIKPASRSTYLEYRKLGGTEQVFAGGLFARPCSVFWLRPSPENTERICGLRDYESRFRMAMNIEALTPTESLMNWCVMIDHQPWFSAAVDLVALRCLATRCGGVLSEAFTQEEVKRYSEFVKGERVHWD